MQRTSMRRVGSREANKLIVMNADAAVLVSDGKPINRGRIRSEWLDLQLVNWSKAVDSISRSDFSI